MRILAINKNLIILLILCISTLNTRAQDATIVVLINEKRKTNVSNAINERYKIQIFSGESEKAKNTLNEFRQEFRNIDGTIVFFTPNYKVWVGSFKTRIEAERNLFDIRKSYRNVHLIRPSKQ